MTTYPLQDVWQVGKRLRIVSAHGGKHPKFQMEITCLGPVDAKGMGAVLVHEASPSARGSGWTPGATLHTDSVNRNAFDVEWEWEGDIVWEWIPEGDV